MNKEIELWQFISDRLRQGQPVMLLVVAESAGSSPGRRGYKMAVGADGALTGSIGGGVMEVALVEQAKFRISNFEFQISSEVVEKVHRKDSPDSSGMICSGSQTVIFRALGPEDVETVEAVIDLFRSTRRCYLMISPQSFEVTNKLNERSREGVGFEKSDAADFTYVEKLGPKDDLYIIGGGHCALALSEIMSKMDFYIRIFDDRPGLNTVEKNRFADEITIVDAYDRIADFVADGPQSYVVVMTLGYKSDETVIRRLIGRNFKYFGVLGSKAKMAELLRSLRADAFPADLLAKIHTPIGIPINSHTPEEIAISIAAEIISVRNGPVRR